MKPYTDSTACILSLIAWVLATSLCLTSCKTSSQFSALSYAGKLYEYTDQMKPRWSSAENMNGVKGGGGKENFGAKGSPSRVIEAGQTLVLLDVQEQGLINRLWITIDNRSPEMLRSLKLEMFWDNATKPAVSVPLADFFGMGLGRMSSFHNVFFASPEGKSFNCLIPMPFRKAAKIQVTNESPKVLHNFFFDVDYQVLKRWDPTNLYFHAFWQRDTATTLAKDFELLPMVSGKGRLLGVNIGINANPLYGSIWWGEGEVKVYLDGDRAFPTLIGTGTEDYIGDAWAQGAFVTDYTGCLISDEKKLQWSYYRYHVPDPIFFDTDCRMTIQQMGSTFKKDVLAAEKAGAPMIPVSVVDGRGKTQYLYKKGLALSDPSVMDGFALFYRSDDVSATAYFYLDSPTTNLPTLQPVALRTANLRSK